MRGTAKPKTDLLVIKNGNINSHVTLITLTDDILVKPARLHFARAANIQPRAHARLTGLTNDIRIPSTVLSLGEKRKLRASRARPGSGITATMITLNQ